MKKKRWWRAAAFLLIAMLLVVAASAFYGEYIHWTVEAETCDYMEELSKQSIRIINERINNDYLYLEGIAKSIGEQGKLIYADTILEILEQRTKTTRFTRLYVSDTDGEVYYKGQEETINVANRRYFQDAMKGTVSVQCIHNEEGKHEIVTAVPIMRDGQVAGAVLGQYAMAEIRSLVDIDYFGGEGYVSIVRPDGHILVKDKNTSEEEDNLKDAAKNRDNDITKEEVARISEAMASGGAGTISFTSNKKVYLMSYLPMEVNDWYLLSVIPKEIINARTLNIFNATLLYGIGVLVVLGCVIAWAFLGWKKNHDRVERAHKNIESIYRTVPGAVVSFLAEDEYRVLSANEAFYHLLGCTEEEFVKSYDARLLNILEEDERKKFREFSEGMNSHEFWLKDAEGEEKWIFGNFDIQKMEGKQVAQAALTDTTRQREKLTKAEMSARIDVLTGLKNKRAIEAELEEILKECCGKGTFIIMDLDNFKQVNDTFGHLEGDRMLKLLADSIREVFRSEDFAGRIGGDEFLVFMRNMTKKDIAAKKAKQLIDKFVGSLPEGVKELGLSVSIGIAISPKDGTKYLELYENADKALYAAKNCGRKCWKFWDELNLR